MSDALREKLVAQRARLDQVSIWRLEAMEETSAVASEARSAGVPIAEIARLLGLSRPTVYALLQP